MFFTEVTGNRVYYARNIYTKVSQKIAVPWILLTPKILGQNISKFVQVCLKAYNFIKNRLQHRRFPVKFAKFLRTLI